MQLNTDDLIKLAESGKITGMYWDEEESCHYPVEIELDNKAKIILHECLYMLKFEKKYYTKGEKKKLNKLRPDYYKGENGKDLFDMFEEEFPKEWTTGFYVLNLVKYVRRYKGKNGIEDLKKARTYLDRLIEFENKSTIHEEMPSKNWSKALAEKQREVFGDSVDK